MVYHASNLGQYLTPGSPRQEGHLGLEASMGYKEIFSHKIISKSITTNIYDSLEKNLKSILQSGESKGPRHKSIYSTAAELNESLEMTTV